MMDGSLTFPRQRDGGACTSWRGGGHHPKQPANIKFAAGYNKNLIQRHSHVFVVKVSTHVYMKPHAVFLADISNFVDRIEGT